jgi:hypothetical protein
MFRSNMLHFLGFDSVGSGSLYEDASSYLRTALGQMTVCIFCAIDII